MKIRVSAVQYHLHNIDSFEQFAHQCEHYVKNAQHWLQMIENIRKVETV